MLIKTSAVKSDQAINFLDYLYHCDSGETFLKLHKDCQSTDILERIQMVQPAFSKAPVSSEAIKTLIDDQLIELHDVSEVDSVLGCYITPKGLTYLQMAKEQKIMPGGDFVLNKENVEIQIADDNPTHLNLRFERPEDFWRSHSLTVKGIIPGVEQTAMNLAKVKVHIVDADTAYFQNDLRLGDLFAAHDYASFHQDLLDNHYVDGESAYNMAELADMLGLVDAANRKVMVFERFVIDPVLIGTGVGKEILRKVLLALGHGGGIVVMPLMPTAAPVGSSEFFKACDRLKQHYRSLGFEEHPFVDNVMVGDIDVVGMMMSADRIRGVPEC